MNVKLRAVGRTRLREEIATWSKAKGILQGYLLVDNNNRSAFALYKKLGW
jgi:ribosomal protein S18 acetylase RimI-like enzyme